MNSLDNLIPLLASAFLVVLSVICLFFPIKYLQFMYRWPAKFNNWVGEAPANVEQKEYLELIVANPSRFAEKHPGAILYTRIQGIICGILGILGFIAIFINW